jgi:hypothetical protein
MDAATRINDLIVISEQLSDVLARENKALRERRHGELDILLPRKDELSRAYFTRIQGLAEHAKDDDVKAVDPALRDRLRERGEQVRGLVEENAQLLTIAREVSRRVLDSVAEAVKASQPKAGTYSAEGRVDAARARSAPPNLPISVDQSL